MFGAIGEPLGDGEASMGELGRTLIQPQSRSGTCGLMPMLACPIFVFGIDVLGRHRGPIGQAAREYGALIGKPRGLQGESYAIPVRDARNFPRPLERVGLEIRAFLLYAAGHPHQVFNVTMVGCDEGEHDPGVIAPTFLKAPANCLLPQQFLAGPWLPV
jgi:hypothetical protein